jgi:tRNA (cmo5U34)-methyltransferase
MSQIFPGEVFASTTDFDVGIRQLLPQYDEMLNAVARCIPSTSRRILELGCGTGELSFKILKRCPDAEIIAVDYSPRMIDFARGKIERAGYDKRWKGIEADFGEWVHHPEKFNIGEGFDGCVSSLAIHHLKDNMKSNLFKRISQSLSAGGHFWNADPVLAESSGLSEVYEAIREEWATQQEISLTEVRAKIGTSSTYGYSNQDQLASLEQHLQMLGDAGFATVAVPWKYYGLAVFGGIK